MRTHISIIVPCFNEQENIPLFYQQVTRVCASLEAHYEFEYIFVNDGSRDHSWRLIAELAHSDPHVIGINLSRNFGHQIALSAGYNYAHGDAIISMDADLQDPPTLIPQLIAQWEQGNAIVYARRLERHESWLKRKSADWYYKILDHISDVRIPRNVGDFRLIDKHVATQLRACPERARYIRGLVAWCGFKASYVDFNRPNRMHGVTAYTWKKMFKLAFDGLTSFSTMPLKLAAYIGSLILFSAGCATTYFTYSSISGTMPSLAAWIILGIYFCIGAQFMCIWILGEYIGRIYDQQKGRPLYIVDYILKSTGTFHASHQIQHEHSIS